MANRKKTPHSMHRSSQRKYRVQGFYTPFTGLDQHLTRISENPSPSSSQENAVAASELPEEAERIFHEAMTDVIPLERKEEKRVPPSPPGKMAPRFLAEEELEVYTHLVGLVKGDAAFELSCSDEYVDGAIVSLSPEILKKLREGCFSCQDYIDLHGYNRDQAQRIVAGFLRLSYARKHRCILIVCGRGLNSQDKQPVLKQALVEWLTHAPLKRLVLAFASARSCDGGSGAVYILLRRNEGKT